MHCPAQRRRVLDRCVMLRTKRGLHPHHSCLQRRYIPARRKRDPRQFRFNEQPAKMLLTHILASKCSRHTKQILSIIKVALDA